MTTPEQPNGAGRRLKAGFQWLEDRLRGLEAFLRAAYRQLRAYRRAVGLVGVAALVAAALLPWWASIWWLPIAVVLLVVPLLLVALFLALPTRLEEFVAQRGVTAISAALTALLLAIAALWLVVNFFWAAQEQLPIRRQATVDVARGGQAAAGTTTATVTVTADYPRVILMNTAVPAMLSLRLEPPAAPLMATVRLPEGLRGPPAGGPYALTLTTFPTDIPLVNDRSLKGTRPGDEIKIDFAGQDSDLALPLAIEGQRGLAIRRFVTTEVNRATPLLLLLALAVPGVAALVQRLIDRRYEELRQLNKTRYDFHQQQFGDNFRAGNWSGAEEALGKMDDDRFREFNTVDLLSFRTMIGLTKLQFDDNGIVQCPGGAAGESKPGVIREVGGRWPDLYAAAYCQAWRAAQEGNQADKAAYLQQLRWEMEELPQEKVALHLRMQLEDVLSQQRIRSIRNHAPRQWPPKLPGWPASPFALHDAADQHEQSFLQAAYTRPAFFEELRHLERPWVIYGAAGAGRTALGTYLLHTSPSQYTLGAYLARDRPTTHHIVARLARQLLDFALANATYLGWLDAAANARLARLLEQYVSPVQALDAINARLGEGEAAEPSGALRRLRRALTDVKSQAAAPDQETADLAALLSIGRALGFRRFVVVIDGGPDGGAWLQEAITSGQMGDWQRHELQLVLLVRGWRPGPGVWEDHAWLRVAELAWDRGALQEIASARISAHQGEPRHHGEWTSFAEIIGTALDEMAGAQQVTPRALVQLLRQLELQPAERTEPFTADQVRAAARVLGWGRARR